jgi:hypothetical protein
MYGSHARWWNHTPNSALEISFTWLCVVDEAFQKSRASTARWLRYFQVADRDRGRFLADRRMQRFGSGYVGGFRPDEDYRV